MIVAKRSGTFVAGGAAGVLMVINMDDLMYGQLRRHVIHPFRMLISQPTVESKEIMELGAGAGKFASQFRPRATARVSAKQLLLDDEDYSTKEDHYFNYINQRQGQLQSRELAHEQDKAILKDLKLESYLSENVRSHIEDLEEDPQESEKKYSFMTQKHSKKDYEMLRDLSVAEIFDVATVKPK